MRCPFPDDTPVLEARRTSSPSSHPPLGATLLGQGLASGPAPHGAGRSESGSVRSAAPAPAAPTRIADKVHYCVSDEWLVKGIMAYAKIKGVDAQEALELLVSECLTMHLDMSW